MAYRYTSFGSLTIPVVGGAQEISPPRPAVYLVPLAAGGAYDPQGSERVWGGAQAVQVHGILTAETAAALAALWEDWAAALGTRATLTRVIATSGANRSETATARLIDVRGSRTAGWTSVQPIDLQFVVTSAHWDGAAHSVGPTTLDTSPKSVTLANDGKKAVMDPVVTLTAGSTEITKVELAIAATNSAIEWSGSLTAGQSLVIDCGARSVKKEGADAYSGFAYGAAHATRGWLKLASGNNSLSVTLTGGGVDSTISVSYNDGWA
jgi:hypothetical protein